MDLDHQPERARENAMKERFEFTSGGCQLVGDLFLPAEKPIAAVVFTGPNTSVKEQAAGAHARALAERGFASLAFDHRYYGESEGEPRQFENPVAKAEDIRAAAAALREAPSTRGLPQAAVGVCAGGGYMARAVAQEPTFFAFSGVAGYYPDVDDAARAANAPRRERGRAAERRWRETGFAETIPAVAPEGGDVAMPLREAYEFYGTARGAVPNYANAYAVQSLAYTADFDAVAAAKEIKIPTLIVHSEHALAPPLARKFLANLAGPREEVWLNSVGQIDFYDDQTLISAASDAVAAFLRKALEA
jgi:uncharacterized protein